MTINITSINTSSNGAWQGDNPLRYAFPLLMIQTTLVLVISRFLAILLKPIRQPKVVAEIIGGIILGPSALGRKKEFLQWIFPSWSTPILESVANMGLLFYLFLVGLELDLTSIRRSGKKAIGIALAGISLPFIFSPGVTFLIRRVVDGADRVGYGQSLIFMGVSLSITAFPVLARILAELKLLTTPVGEISMAAAAFNDVAAWILLALAVALAGNGTASSNPLTSLWVLTSGAAFVAFMLILVRPAMFWLSPHFSPTHELADEARICLTLAGVMVSGFTTDLIGIHAIFGAFVFGLMIPKGEFAGRLIKRMEDFVSGLLLPLYFASSGLKTNVATIRGVEAWGILALVISTACAGKIIGTFVVGLMCKIPAWESLTLGVLMNTKGLVELIVLNIGRERKVLNDETFAILVLMALFTTFMTTPVVMAIYAPARGISSRLNSRQLRQEKSTAEDKGDEFRVLACVHRSSNSPSLINLIETTRPTEKPTLKLYVMHLVELTDKPSSIVMVHRARRNGFPCVNRFRGNTAHNQVVAAFEAYGHLCRVTVRPTTAISTLPTMHEDICHVAKEKAVTLIILPFHKQWRGGGEEEVENVGNGWQGVNQQVLKNAPCSVAVLVDRGIGFSLQPSNTVVKRVCIVFFGGPDDRKALELGSRMVEHPAVRVTIIRFVHEDGCSKNDYSFSPAQINPEGEKELDNAAVSDFQRRWDGTVEYTETVTNNIAEGVLAIGRNPEYELLIVGKGWFPPAMAAEFADWEIEHVELGPTGDLLASSGRGILPSILVVQQRSLAHLEESTVSKMVYGRDVAV
ncbi:hypothetical protein NMG60_11000394 [Bertholletia excelsa]